MSNLQFCTKGIWDSTVPGIKFDPDGVSNYASIHEHLCKAFPQGDEGQRIWKGIVQNIKQAGKGKKYDCIIGVSGGTDSSYLLHLAKNVYGLRPLAVNLDNGWNSEIAVQNIKKVTKALAIDLETYVIDYQEIQDLLRVYMKAGLPWIDNPTDLAIQSILFKVAAQEKIKYILAGNDFRSEGKQPTEWTYSDQKQLRFLHRKFGTVKLKSYPLLSIYQYLWLSLIKGKRFYYPYNYLGYDKQNAQKLIIEKYGWSYYGEHHHENLFTKWAIGYWMYEKFGIDKRKITYSAQVLSNALSRDEALKITGKNPFTPDEIKNDTSYVLKKLELSPEEFSTIWSGPNKSFLDYPSYYTTFRRFAKSGGWFLKTFMKMKPKILIEIQERK
jgi:N-acetyl sugar amidotransferase